MKLTILGSGTVVPDGSRNSSGYFIETPSMRMMMDCGAGTVHALARYGVPWEEMTHLFISHFHADHVGELASLMFAFKWGMKTRRSQPLTLLGPAGLDRMLKALDDALDLRLGELKFPVEPRELQPAEEYRLAPGCILSVAKTPHTRVSLAARIDDTRIDHDSRSICYTGDTAYSEDLRRFFAGTDLMISECSYEQPNPDVAHLSVREVSMMAEQARAARLVVTHFYFDVDELDLASRLRQRYSGDVIIGRDGMCIEI
jgi:ribonuclease BN (tRNA processing enzyme)